MLDEIKGRFGFVPPFFLPAAGQPEVLKSLWQQTLTAYVDNPLPGLLKERMAAYLGRYCAVPYCLMCHSCSLRPLGIGGEKILELLRTPLASSAEVALALEIVRRAGRLQDLPTDGPLEQALIVLSGEMYRQAARAGEAREVVSELVGPERYNLLILFISYNKMCHAWMEAHPTVSYELDQRYLSNFEAIVAEAPEIRRYLAETAPQKRKAPAERAEVETWWAQTVTSRAQEAERMLEAQERRLEEVAQELQARAEQAARRRGLEQEVRLSAEFAQELLAIVSHDLRSPLSAIMNAASMLVLVDPSNERITQSVNLIIRSTQRASRMVGNLLDFSQARMGGGIPLQPAPADIHDLARQVVDELQAAHPTRHIILEHRGMGKGQWDADRIIQMLSNVLGNALSHSPESTPVWVTTLAENGEVAVEIKNDNREGPIPPQLLPHLFEPFRRGTQRSTSKTKSVGLGLFIVDHLVKAHRGEVDVRSNEQGTSFTVHLPRRP